MVSRIRLTLSAARVGRSRKKPPDVLILCGLSPARLTGYGLEVDTRLAADTQPVPFLPARLTGRGVESRSWLTASAQPVVLTAKGCDVGINYRISIGTNAGWRIPNEPYEAAGTWYSQTAGQTYNVSQHVDSTGTTFSYSITSQTKNAVVGEYGFTIDQDTGVITVPADLPEPANPTTTDSYVVSVGLAATGGDAEDDWIKRSTGDGVVWAHDFRIADEVYNFRTSQDAIDLSGTLVKQGKSMDKAGTGYHTIDWGTDQIPGTNGRSLLTYAPKAFGAGKYYSNENAYAKSVGGAGDGSNVYSSYGAAPESRSVQQLCFLEMIGGGAWSRPFYPMTYKDGSLPDDPAAGGTIPLFQWDPTDIYQQGYWQSFYHKGFFTHQDYATPAELADGKIIGHEFWLQFRVKFNSGRFAYRADPSNTGSNPETQADFVANKPAYPLSYGKQFTPAGKLAFIGKYSGAEQYIIPISGTALYEYFYPGGVPFNWYGKYGGMPSQIPLPDNPSIWSIQPESPYELTCTTTPAADLTQQNMCWMWEPDEWVTVLVHIRPGHHNDTVDGGYNDTLIEFKAARWGEKDYTTIYSANRGVVFSQDGDPYGWSSFALDCYFNNVPSFAYISQTYTQIILSKQAIPCPQVY